MYNFTLQYVDQNSMLNETEFQSPSPYIDSTTMSYMQIHLNTVIGSYQEANSVGIVLITPSDLSNYGLKNLADFDNKVYESAKYVTRNVNAHGQPCSMQDNLALTDELVVHMHDYIPAGNSINDSDEYKQAINLCNEFVNERS